MEFEGRVFAKSTHFYFVRLAVRRTKGIVKYLVVYLYVFIR